MNTSYIDLWPAYFTLLFAVAIYFVKDIEGHRHLLKEVDVTKRYLNMTLFLSFLVLQLLFINHSMMVGETTAARLGLYDSSSWNHFNNETQAQLRIIAAAPYMERYTAHKETLVKLLLSLGVAATLLQLSILSTCKTVRQGAGE